MMFFFKQKTAYGIRISDWSSDVCSSDLLAMTKAGLSVSTRKSTVMSAYFRDEDAMDLDAMSSQEMRQFFPSDIAVTKRLMTLGAIGRESCRETVCKYVHI